MAAIGRYAADIAKCDTPGGYDPGSPFDLMLKLDFKVLLLGADIFYTSMVQYVEQEANVPYRYWKDFRGKVRTPEGWQDRTYRMFVRDLELNPQLTLEPIVADLQQRGQWHSLALNYGYISACRLTDFVASGLMDSALADETRVADGFEVVRTLTLAANGPLDDGMSAGMSRGVALSMPVYFPQLSAGIFQTGGEPVRISEYGLTLGTFNSGLIYARNDPFLDPLRGDPGAWVVYEHGKPELKTKEGAARTNLVGKYSGVFEPAYVALRTLGGAVEITYAEFAARVRSLAEASPHCSRDVPLGPAGERATTSPPGIPAV